MKKKMKSETFTLDAREMSLKLIFTVNYRDCSENTFNSLHINFSLFLVRGFIMLFITTLILKS